jgi:hypothetical protein
LDYISITMGSFISAHNMFSGNNESNKHRTCYCCSKKIDDKTFIICVRCKIALHNDCEASYGHKYYTVCPRCDRGGSLGTMYANT